MKVKSQTNPSGYGNLSYSLLTFEPKRRGKRFPLILALHGRGGSGEQYITTWIAEAERRQIMVLTPTIKQLDIKMFDDLTQRISDQYPVDKNQMFLAGVSSGGLIARWIAAKSFSHWKGVIFIASPVAKKWTTDPELKNFPPMLFVHGEKDDQFKIEGIRTHVENLRKRNVKTELLSYPNGRHEHRSEWNKDIFDWIEKNNKAAV